MTRTHRRGRPGLGPNRPSSTQFQLDNNDFIYILVAKSSRTITVLARTVEGFESRFGRLFSSHLLGLISWADTARDGCALKNLWHNKA